MLVYKCQATNYTMAQRNNSKNSDCSIRQSWSPATWDSITNTYVSLEKQTDWCSITWDSRNVSCVNGKKRNLITESPEIIIFEPESLLFNSLDCVNCDSVFEYQKREREFLRDSLN